MATVQPRDNQRNRGLGLDCAAPFVFSSQIQTNTIAYPVFAIAVLFCIAPVICFAQQSSHKLSDYAGTWQAKFQGTTFMTINLVEKNGHLTGSASFGDIQADPSGAIKAVDAPAADSEWPIVSSRLLPSRGLEITSHGDNETIIVVLELINAITRVDLAGVVSGKSICIDLQGISDRTAVQWP